MAADQAWKFRSIIGHVNATEVAGISPKKLMVSSIETEGVYGSVRFMLRNSVPWTHMLSLFTGKFTEVCDSEGNPIYPLVDFHAV